MKDIAEDLNVSVVTVSKVLRNQGDISEQTRRRVLERAKELNYQPNWVARSLVTRKTFLIGLVVPDLMSSFFAEIAKGISREVRPAGYNIVIANSEEDPQIELQEIEMLRGRQVDGLIIASAQPPSDGKLFQRLEDEKVPFVLIDRAIGGEGVNFVGVRDEEIGEIVTTHLIEQGCRRLAHIRGPENGTGVGRLKGFRNAIARHGLNVSPDYIVRGEFNDAAGYDAMCRLLSMDPRPDGVVCYNDPVAAGAVKAALASGLRVPEDVAFTGAGNVHYLDLLRVPITTVDQSTARIGESAGELLLEMFDSKTPREPRQILIPPRIVIRESSRRS